MSKNNASYIRRVCTTVDNRSMKVFKLLLQISAVCPVWHIRIYPLINPILPSSILLMLSKMKTIGCDYAETPCSMDEALSLACELEAFRLLDRHWRRSSVKVRSVDEAVREPDLFKVQLEMLRNDIQMQQQRQETQHVALQQLVQNIQQPTQSMSLNTPGSQQRLPASRYSSRCWYCNESGHYRRNCPKYKSLKQADLGSGNASRVLPMGQGDAKMRVMLAPQQDLM